MRSTIASLTTVAVGLLASTASAKGKVAIYWGQGAYQKELSVVCNDPSVDIVNIAFVNGFPKDKNKYPDTNFGNACGPGYFLNPDGTTSKLLSNCPTIETGISACHKNGKQVLLSLGGGYPTDYYIASKEAAKWLAEVLVGSFGPQTDGQWPRPFGAAAVDGFDLDIESSSAVGAQKYQYYAELVNYIKELSPRMLISSAPQCVVPDAHLDDAIARAPFDYIFTQFYNTDECSAKRGFQERNLPQTGFTFDKWTERLQKNSYNKNVKLFMGLIAGTNGGNSAHYLLPDQANALVEKYQNTALWGGIMLWEATVSQNNTRYGQAYSNWMRYSLDGTFKEKYVPVVSSSTRSSSTLISSTKTSTPIASSTKTSTLVSSTKTSTPIASSTKTSTPVASSSSSLPHSSKSSSVVLSSSSSYHATSSSSSVAPSATSSIEYSDYFSTLVPTDYSASSSSVAPSATSSIEYSDYFSTVVPTDYSASSSSVEPSSVYREDVSSTAIYSSSSADVTSSAPTSTEASSTPLYTTTTSASDIGGDYSATTPADASSTPCTTSTELYPESSKTPDVSSSASEYLSYSESSKVPEASSSVASSSIVYPTESTKTPEISTGYSASSSTPLDAASTPCSTSTELYPTSTPEASSATEYSYYSESSKTPEVSTKITEYPSVSTKTPEVSSSASEYSFYSESSPVPAVSTKTSEYPVEYPTEYPIVSTKTPEASEYEILSTATPTVTKPAESTTTVVTTTYVDTCSTGLTTKTTVITKTVCNACAKPSDKPEADYPEDWTTSVYVSKTLTVTITKPIHPATDVPAYPTEVPEYPTAPKPSAPAAEYPVGKEEVPSYETPAKSSSVPYEATKPSPKPEVPSYPEVPSVEKPSEPEAEYPVASSKPYAPEQYVTLTKVATPVAYTPVAYATPVAHQGYPVGNLTVPSGTGVVKPSATGTGKPIKPSGYAPPEFEGAASKLGMGMTGIVAVVAFLVL